MSRLVLVIGLRADHGGIIPGEGKRRHKELPAVFFAALPGAAAQPAVGRNAACQHQLIAPVMPGRLLGFFPQDTADVAAEAGGQIGRCQRLPFLRRVVRQVDDRGLEPRKREIERALGVGGGQRVGCRVALVGDGIQRHAAGIRQPHRAGGFIKGLTGGVVGGAAEDGVVAVIPHQHDMAVPSTDDQRQKGRLQLRVGQIVGRHMPPDMVHRDQRLGGGQRQSLGKVDPHQHRADQAGGGGNGHGVGLPDRKTRLLQRSSSHAADGFGMAAGGDLRHHPAVQLVFLHLGMDHRGQNPSAVLYDSGGGLITAGFNA